MVGDRDVEREGDLRKSRAIDEMEGETRLERGRRWILAMAEAAKQRGFETPYAFEILKGSNHSFTTCMIRSDMGRKVFEFLFGPPPSP
jgi:hypothetical protein